MRLNDESQQDRLVALSNRNRRKVRDALNSIFNAQESILRDNFDTSDPRVDEPLLASTSGDFRDLWQDAVEKGAEGIDVSEIEQNGRIDDYLLEKNFTLTQDLINAQDGAFSEIAQTTAGITLLLAMIRLTGRQARTIRRRFEDGVTQRELLNQAGGFYRLRVERIARTETSDAFNFGALEAVRQAQERGELNGSRKTFYTALDERVCPQCGPLHGVSGGINDASPPQPPLHVGCRCILIYEEG